MRKGMALPIETIVVIILAVMVLVILTTYFLGVWGEKKQTADQLQQQLTGSCLEYITKAASCDYQSLDITIRQNVQNAVSNIKLMCNQPVGNPVCSCRTGASDQEIIRTCCRVYCP